MQLMSKQVKGLRGGRRMHLGLSLNKKLRVTSVAALPPSAGVPPGPGASFRTVTSVPLLPFPQWEQGHRHGYMWGETNHTLPAGSPSPPAGWYLQ